MTKEIEDKKIKKAKVATIELGDKIWEAYTPIVRTTKDDVTTYDIYIQEEIESPAHYNEMCHVLHAISKKDYVNLHINTPGGYLDSAFKITEAIDACKAEITAVITGTVASAGTMIALRCDKLVVPKHLQFMIHNYSGGTSGKGNEIIEHVTFSNAEITTAFGNIYSGFLTDKEIKAVIKGKDMWMGAAEVAKRWTKMKGGK